MYKTAKELLQQCNERNQSLPQCILDTEKEITTVPVTKIKSELLKYYRAMMNSSKATLDKEVRSLSGLTGGNAKKLYDYAKEHPDTTLCGTEMLKTVSYALSTSEVNVSMGVICAAPTAGASGIMSAVCRLLLDGANDDLIVDALLVAGAIGQIVEQNATISGAEGGCQAECGTGCAMASGMAVFVKGGSNEQVFNAAALCFKSLLGLVCDPVAGNVEAPCIKRNATSTAVALLCADMSLAGIQSVIPFDEVVSAMDAVGKMMPKELRETSLGGLANTPTAKEIAKRLNCQK